MKNNIYPEIIEIISTKLRATATVLPEHAARFFKTSKNSYAEHDKFLGVTIPNLRIIAKEFASLSLDEIQYLLYSAFNEERLLALIILTTQYKKFNLETRETIYQFYLSNLKYVNNWNLVDSSAHLIIGAHLLNQNKDLLLELTKSASLWERRIAIVTTWYFIKNDQLDWTFKIAQMLINDNQDLIHKAVGWMLREAGKRNEVALTDFLDQYAKIMPRTMLRYSLEKLSLSQKSHYMKL